MNQGMKQGIGTTRGVRRVMALFAVAMTVTLLLPMAAQAKPLSAGGTNDSISAGYAIKLGTLLQVSKSRADRGGARWDAVIVAGQSLYGVHANEDAEGNTSYGSHGLLAPLIDPIKAGFNSAPCAPQLCVKIMQTQMAGTYGAGAAQGWIAHAKLLNGVVKANVGNSFAAWAGNDCVWAGAMYAAAAELWLNGQFIPVFPHARSGGHAC